MAHENDPERNGCEFAQMFQTTPQDLIDDGLYKSIAIALHEMPHREVSLALVAQACGAKPSKTKQRPRRLQVARKLRKLRTSRDKGGAGGNDPKLKRASKMVRQQEQEIQQFEREEAEEEASRGHGKGPSRRHGQESSRRHGEAGPSAEHSCSEKMHAAACAVDRAMHSVAHAAAHAGHSVAHQIASQGHSVAHLAARSHSCGHVGAHRSVSKQASFSERASAPAAAEVSVATDRIRRQLSRKAMAELAADGGGVCFPTGLPPRAPSPFSTIDRHAPGGVSIEGEEEVKPRVQERRQPASDAGPSRVGGLADVRVAEEGEYPSSPQGVSMEDRGAKPHISLQAAGKAVQTTMRIERKLTRARQGLVEGRHAPPPAGSPPPVATINRSSTKPPMAQACQWADRTLKETERIDRL